MSAPDAGPMQVCECLYDPRWSWATLPDGNIVMRLHHPRHGLMDFVLGRDTQQSLLTFLNNHLEQPTNAVVSAASAPPSRLQ